MKQAIAFGCIVLLMGSMTFSVFAQYDNWGHSGATPAPVKDTERDGHWWWPKEPAADATADAPWGNRGKVYGQLETERTAFVSNDALFQFDDATLTEQGKGEVASLASYLKRYSGDNLEIQGHTCNTNLSGDPKYNMRLGLRRANSVRAALLEFGVASSRLSAISLGETDPAVPNDSVKNRAMNRRVVFVLNLPTS